MLKSQLKLLDLENLIPIAEKAKISFAPNISKEDLLALIIDALEEDREEKISRENYAVSIEKKKYALYLKNDEDILLEDLLFPQSHKTYIAFLVKDSSWLYIYWNINNKKLQYQNFAIKIYYKTLNETSFDIRNIAKTQSSLFIPITDKNKEIDIELGALVDNNEFICIAKSMPFLIKKEYLEKRNKLYFLSS